MGEVLIFTLVNIVMGWHVEQQAEFDYAEAIEISGLYSYLGNYNE